MPKSKKRKGAYFKETATHCKAQIARKRRDPAFRKHENQSRDEVTLAVDYLTLIVNTEDPTNLLENSQEVLARMGGLEGLNEFLDYLEALKADWRERLSDEGYILLSAVSPEGIDFALQNEEDKLESIG